MGNEFLPDDRTVTLAVTLTTAEVRELIRAAAYRADDLKAKADPTGEVLEAAYQKVGDAFNVAVGSEPATLNCYRCGRKYRLNERDQLVDAGAGKLKCDPKGPLYDACMSTYNTV
jgi:hypothetical protein